MVYLPFSQFPLTLTYSIAQYILTNNTINKTADFILILLSFLFFYKMLFLFVSRWQTAFSYRISLVLTMSLS